MAEKCYYVPHHAVIRESSSPTRLSVLFDGLWHARGARSMNDLLEKRLQINNDMGKTLVNFWLNKTGAHVQKALEWHLTQIVCCSHDAPYTETALAPHWESDLSAILYA